VVPRAARDEVGGERQGALVVRLTAPPAENRANDALRKLLAERLRIPRGRVEIVGGQRSRTKRVRIAGLTEDQVAKRLEFRNT
jgi:uncharacterized protein